MIYSIPLLTRDTVKDFIFMLTKWRSSMQYTCTIVHTFNAILLHLHNCNLYWKSVPFKCVKILIAEKIWIATYKTIFDRWLLNADKRKVAKRCDFIRIHSHAKKKLLPCVKSAKAYNGQMKLLWREPQCQFSSALISKIF